MICYKGNFAFLEFINKIFAPYFKKIKLRANKLCGFKPVKSYNNLLITPVHKIDKQLIIDEWDNIQRIIASLLLGETAQRIIVKKLASYKRVNKTQKALWEFDSIIMSLYFLDYVDDITIMQGVRGSLNRGEAYHQLRRSVACVNGKNFRGTTEIELAIWNECGRLLANSIIFYNAKLISALFDRYTAIGNVKVTAFLKRISPVAWINVNLNGHYEFSEHELDIDFIKMIENFDGCFDEIMS